MKIELRNVSKKIKNEQILNNISIEFETGHIYGLSGRNGSGKSMLLKTICGFIKPDNGEVIVNNENIYKNNSFPKDTRAMFDNSLYLSDLTGYENLELLSKIQNKITEKDILNTLKDVLLYDVKDKKFSQYSLGMKQKLGIAQVLMENPSIMIFDEPFNGLDNESAEKIRKILLKNKKNKIIIIATHVKEDLDNLCDIKYLIDAGRIIK